MKHSPTLLLLLGVGVAGLRAAETPAIDHTLNKPAWVQSRYRLPDFPKTSPEKAFAELKQFQSDGSPYRTAIEDWEGARQRIANDPAWNRWLAGQQAQVDAWITREHDRPGWSAGWNHDFVSPTDGSFLVWTPDVPGEDVPSLTSRTGERVEITPKLFNAWVGTSRKKNAAMISQAARLFRLTGRTEYADWAAGQLDFYTQNYDSWPVSSAMGMPARLGFQSLDDAVIVAELVEGARLLFDWAGPARRQSWFDRLFKPEAELLNRSYQYIHNISTWQRATQASIALLYKNDVLWRTAMDGPFGLRAQLKHGVTSDYFWHEQSMNYGNFIVVATQPLLTFASLIGEKKRLQTEASIVENLLLAPLYVSFPNGKLPNPSDSNSIPNAYSSRLTEIYRILPTTLGLQKAGATYSWETLVDPPTKPAAPANLPAVVSANLESSRFALLKQGPWQVFFHYGQLTRSHSQAEALNWSASFNGTDISHDPGTVGYGSPLHAGYYQRGLCHNVPLADGEGQLSWNPGVLERFDPDAAVVTAAQPFYRPDVATRRTLRIDGAALIDDTSITLTGARADKPARLGLSLHLQGITRVPNNFEPVTPADFARGRTEAFRQWDDVCSATFEDRTTLEVEFPGERVLTITFETPGPFTLYVGRSPDRLPDRRAGFYIETEGHTQASFTTTLAPRK
jgi:oligo-alginate lyase